MVMVGVRVGVDVGPWRLRMMMTTSPGTCISCTMYPTCWLAELKSGILVGTAWEYLVPSGGISLITACIWIGWVLRSIPIVVEMAVNTLKELSAGKSCPGICWLMVPVVGGDE